jgi:hypothetical protein
MEICNTANYMLVAKNKFATEKRCIEIWEEIVQRNAEVNGNYTYMNWFRASREYYKLISEHALVKAILQKFSFTKTFKRFVGPTTDKDKVLVAVLGQRGYVLDFRSSEQFAESIYANMLKSQNLVTKITMKRNEINGFVSSNGAVQGFEEVMADLIASLNVNVDDNITLARYNEYKKVIKLRHKQSQKVPFKNKR